MNCAAASLLGFSFLAACSGVLLGQQPGSTASTHVTLARAPADTSLRLNPYAGQPQALAAGRKLYRRHCATCHDADPRGERRGPNLAVPHIRNAAPGSLFWLLRNGDLKRGMPSWSHLPDQRLWQIVTYLNERGKSS